MNEKELTDVLYSIKDIIKNENEDGPNTQLRHIDDLVEWALAQEGDGFPVPQEELAEFLENFGTRESRNVCTGKISGEFCYADYNYSDEEYIIFELKYGVNDGDENVQYTDYFRISIYDFQNCKTFDEKYNAVQEA